MGKEIVYCGDCGQSLREDDFTKGKAHHIDHRPFCTACKPLPASSPAPYETSSKLAALSKSSSSRVASAPAPSTRRRPAQAESSRLPLMIAGGCIAAAIVLILIFTLSSSGPTPRIPEPPAPAPAVVGPPKAAPKPTPAAPDVDKAAAALKELETLVSASSAPIAVLQRCDEIRPLLKGTPHEARLKAIEDRAREERRVQQLEASLEEVKRLRALDPGYERKEEIVRLLNATLTLSGSRRSEVEETLRAYQRDAQAYVPAATAAKQPLPPNPSPSPIPSASGQPLGPFDTDATGCVNHWLVIGPFPNRAHRDGLYDGDLLSPEAQHIPVAGKEVAARDGPRPRWTPTVVTDGKVYFRKVLDPAPKPAAPGIAFAACWIEAEQDLEVKFKMYAEAGFIMFLDHQRARNQPGGHMFGEEEDIVRYKL